MARDDSGGGTVVVAFVLGALTGAAVVFATFQVTAWVVPGKKDAPAAGTVTTNGPLLPSTFSVI